jgi:hypothetical protein
MEHRLCSAIARRHQVSFNYEGERLTVLPHLLGVTSAGNSAIRAYLLTGNSKSGDEPPWRMYRLDRMARLTVHRRNFVTQRLYRSKDKGLGSVRCRIRNSRK